jgi:hypothetical protein
VNISLSSSGKYVQTLRWIDKMRSGRIFDTLDSYGRRGVDALARATPRETGETASSWSYKIERSRGRYAISWYNTHRVDGVNIAVIIQYGHGTGTGGYVQGIDYINPAMRDLFQQIADDIWREVTGG